MSDAFYSPSWYRIADLKPQLRGHSKIHRQLYRGELWYVLQDPITGNIFRFSPVVYQIIGLMDGKINVQKLWEGAMELNGDDAPSQIEMIALLSRLHTMDLLICDVTQDTKELLLRGQKKNRSIVKNNLLSPLFMRFPLGDPERFLSSTIALTQVLFTKKIFFFWLLVVCIGISLAWSNWNSLSSSVIDKVLSGENLLILGCIYPVIKGFHELGHAYAVKKWGGEVHEMGIMLLVFMPIPYVDASAASAFQKKWQRVVVGAAGMGVELFLAAIAVGAWLVTEPGLVHAIAYNVILIGGVSTVLFNGNPLLKFDGYYIFADLLDIPNLATRSRDYLAYLLKKYCFAIESESFYVQAGEKYWFVLYGVASFCYRIVIVTAIILFVATKFFVIGLLLAAWGIVTMALMPAIKSFKKLINEARFQEKTRRVAWVSSLFFLLVFCLFFLIPFPYLTKTEGVFWIDDNALVRSSTNGIVSHLAADPSSRVTRGVDLITLQDPFLETETQIILSRLSEFQKRYDAVSPTDETQAKIIKEEIVNIQGQLQYLQERTRSMQIKSPAQGIFVVPHANDLENRFVKQGDLLGYVVNEDTATVRIVVPQQQVDLVRRKNKGVELIVSTDMKKIYSGEIIREVPGAVDQLPSMALGVEGGGKIVVDPKDESRRKTFTRMFQFDVALKEPLQKMFVGCRVYVRFNHGQEPLGFRWARVMRQLFIKRFHV